MTVLTTHVGSLPRPKNVTDLLFKRENNEVYEQDHFDEVISNGVYDVVKKQIEIGLKFDGVVEILSGIQPDDLIVYEGINKIRDGSIVKIK